MFFFHHNLLCYMAEHRNIQFNSLNIQIKVLKLWLPSILCTHIQIAVEYNKLLSNECVFLYDTKQSMDCSALLAFAAIAWGKCGGNSLRRKCPEGTVLGFWGIIIFWGEGAETFHRGCMRNCLGWVYRCPMQDYKSLSAVVMKWDTLVITHTDTFRVDIYD